MRHRILWFFACAVGWTCLGGAPGAAAKPRDFKCVSSAHGTRTCVGSLPKKVYPQPIAVIFPRAVENEPPNWILYLHGNNSANNDLAYQLDHYRLAESLGRSGRRSILVFPLSRATSASATIDYRDYLAHPEKFRAFLDSVRTVLRKTFGLRAFATPERIHLMGHSGAYRTLAAILRNQASAEPGDPRAYAVPIGKPATLARISEVVLLDALYGEIDEFARFGRFALEDRPGIARLWSVYGSRGGLARNNACLVEKVRAETLTSADALFGDCPEWKNPCDANGAAPVAPQWDADALGDLSGGPAYGDHASSCRPRFKVSEREFAQTRVGILKTHVPHDGIPQDLLAPLWSRGGGFERAPCAGAEQSDTGLACVDRWEETTIQAESHEPWSPYAMPSGIPLVAVSQPDLPPQAYISGVEAADACARAGKRLCTEAEWQDACQGPSELTYPYGKTYVAGTCNDHRDVHPVIQFYGTDASWIWSYAAMNNPGINQQPSTLAPTGDRAGCLSEHGIADLVGNVHEWVSGGVFRGGFYVDAEINGSGCLYRTTAHGPRYHDYSTGFRCCQDRGRWESAHKP